MPKVIIIEGQPATKKTHQVITMVHGRPRLLQSQAYRKYERLALQQLMLTRAGPFNGPVEVSARYWLKDKRLPDLANLMAATADILEKAGIIENDRLIASWDGSRIMGQSDAPRVEIIIRELTPSQEGGPHE